MVYQAVDNRTKKKVAVKVYKNSSSQLRSIKVRMNVYDDQ